ncbi:DNA helicase-2/ATP-dependent DNA helicase PcrA [Keratinibaculum paraultunense]|uniref:ATP-dependent DNA helicase n=1 Tax=Keratinibaculum paraultunense TaxID=1278232 RepID=A0A4V2UUG7_9FIRM|nr:DNA helicase PcrA [Keratinibaculum paraultunense]QQY80195.1 DNA helicase PcrA [Keratinibaculum paraultunense]TCS90706.1 DNA helicase-2/ATP-dependent DNA helicase PcrA [Keratinibaculum paraultunense]
MDYISGLNDRQKEAVLHPEGPLLILAGAGSGKTRVLTHRIAYLIEERKIFPGNILAITFTNKAANEMKERVAELLGGDIGYIWMGTFHSICVRILRQDIDKIGYDRSFSIYDRDDQITLMKECIKEQNLNKDIYKERSILGNISSLKDAMISPDTYINQNYNDYYRRNVGELYALYQKKLKQNNALDFDDLIIKTLELFRADPMVLDYYQKKFKYIFVDEFQDTNKSQYELIRLLADKHKNLCVVGDDDQSIYKFRGADITNILNFEKDFPNTKIIKLEQNYRSTKNILNVANHVIKNNSERKDKSLWTDNEEGNLVVVETLPDSQEEAYFVANMIEKLMVEGYKPSDFAILYRTNAQSRTFEEVFIKRGIPYKIVGGLRFYDRKEIKDILAYLKLIQNPVDDISLKRIINVPKRGIGNATMGKIEQYANEVGESIYSVLQKLDDIPDLSTRAKNSIKGFVEIVNNLMRIKEQMSIKDFIEEVLKETNYIKELEKQDDIESRTRLENIREFISVAVDFEVKNPEGNLEDFLATVSLLSDVDKTEDLKNTATMLTVHSAKGLEFPVVFLVGMEEGLFPIFRALDNESELEEERRLCYVAITRAQKLLFITHAKIRTIYGNTSYSLPSRFIDEIPKNLITTTEESSNLGNNKRRLVNIVDRTKRRKNNTVKSQENKDKVQVGTKVNHKKWGIGTVVQIKNKDEDKELVIAFNEPIGLKRLLLSIAPIEIVKGD